MGAPSVTFDGTRVDAAQAEGGIWTDLGGGKAATEEDVVYQGGAAVSEKVGATENGVALDMAGTIDYTTPKVWIAKIVITNIASLDDKGATGGILEIGSGGRRSAYDRYYVVGGNTYPIKGGYLIIPIDPNGGNQSARPGSAPTLTVIDYYGWMGTFGANSKVENVIMDAVDHINSGKGLTLVDGVGDEGTFAAFIAEDEGIVANRWGIVSTLEGIIYITGVLTIGSSSETDFTDVGRVLVFPEAEFLNSVGFFGIDIDLSNASSVILITGCVFTSQGTVGGSVDTRPDYGFIGTSGVGEYAGCTIDVFRQIIMTSGATLQDSVFSNGLLVEQHGGIIDGCTFSGATTADGVAHILSDDPGLITDCDFTFSDGHAIEINTTGTYDFDGNVFTGYGADDSNDAAIYNNSGGLVTLNVLNAAVPTIRNGSGASTDAAVNVILKVTVKDEAQANIQDAQTSIHLTSDNTELMNEDTLSTGVAEQAYNYTGDVEVQIKVRKSSGSPRYKSFSQLAIIGSGGIDLPVTLEVDPNVDL